VNIGDALREAADRLRAAGFDNGPSEAVALWGLVSPSAYIDRAEDANADSFEKFWAMVERRARREPFSHISGRRQFYKSVFRVTPDVLDPRPETEILVELALQAPFSRVLDLGIGSGCILISLLLEMPSATGVGTDISEKAILVAGQNAEELGVADRLILPLSDWYADIGVRFDLIVSNPAYISAQEMTELQPEVCDHEPRIALTDEADGLTAYRKIAAGALDHLTPGGRLMVEIGPTQGEAVRKLFMDAGLENPVIHPDLDGRERVVSAVAPNV
jgi:release factor glutamine methyltransferase